MGRFPTQKVLLTGLRPVEGTGETGVFPSPHRAVLEDKVIVHEQ